MHSESECLAEKISFFSLIFRAIARVSTSEKLVNSAKSMKRQKGKGGAIGYKLYATLEAGCYFKLKLSTKP